MRVSENKTEKKESKNDFRGCADALAQHPKIKSRRRRHFPLLAQYLIHINTYISLLPVLCVFQLSQSRFPIYFHPCMSLGLAWRSMDIIYQLPPNCKHSSLSSISLNSVGKQPFSFHSFGSSSQITETCN